MAARIILILTLLMSAACAPLKSYRTDYELCVSPNPDVQCRTHALQQYNETDGSGHLLGFIELDDQGQLFDRAQMQAVLGAISTEVAPDSQDFLMVVFVHGWKHNAAPGDDNVATFRRVLVGLSKSEQAVNGRFAAIISEPAMPGSGRIRALPVRSSLNLYTAGDPAHAQNSP